MFIDFSKFVLKEEITSLNYSSYNTPTIFRTI